jgi:subfamily B ATP-binding cassette protein MsbA
MSQFIFGFNAGFAPKGRQKRPVIIPVEFRRLFATVRGYRAWLALSVPILLIAGAANGAVAFLVKIILDNVLAPTNPQSSKALTLFTNPFTGHPVNLNEFVPTHHQNPGTLFAIALLAVFIIKGLAEFGGTMIVQYVGLSAVTDLRNRAFAKLIRQPIGFFQKHMIGRLMSALINDVERVRIAMSEYLADFILQFFTLIAFGIVLLLINWKMALISLVIVPVLAVPVGKLGRKIRKSVEKSQARLGELNQAVQETISGNRVVKAFGMEEFETGRFKETARRLLRENLRWIRAYVLNGVLMDLLSAVVIALVILYARGLINHGAMTLGDFGAFCFALFSSYTPIKRIGIFYQQLEQARGATAEVFNILAMDEEQPDKPGAIALPPFSNEIELEDVNFSYDAGAQVLQDVYLTARAGEVIAIVGSSGAGKTTLANLLPRFYSPTSGVVRFDGHDISDVTLKSLRDQIAIVTQENILFNDTVWNNICYGTPNQPKERVIAAAQAALAHDFITEMPQGYQTQLGDRGQRLSGGQRQRLAIARAILKDSPILILDEATSELDTESELFVQKALANLMVGRTVFVIAHRLSTIRRANKIIVLEGGSIRESGTHQELLALNGLYTRLYELQFADADALPQFRRRSGDTQEAPEPEVTGGIV